MDTSYWSNLPVQQIERNQLWYNQYAICVALRLYEASVLRNLNHDKIAKTIKLRREYRDCIRTQQPGSWAGLMQVPVITEADEQNLHSMCDLLLSESNSYRLMVSGNSLLNVYTNNSALISKLVSAQYVEILSITKIIEVTGLPNQIKLKNPRYNFRSYFKAVPCTELQVKSIAMFLEAQSDIQMSRSLQQWLNRYSTRLKDHLFFDCNDAMMPFMLNLIIPGVIRKTVSITANDK